MFLSQTEVMKKGFSLIELLVITGIIAVVAMIFLFFANYQESQRRSRDATRLLDIAKLVGAMEAYLGDFGQPPVTSANSATVMGRKYEPCDNNWLGFDLCAYIQQIPLDPWNGRVTSFVNHPNAALPRTSTVGNYSFAVQNGSFEFCTRLESEKSRDHLNDNGSVSSLDVFEAGPDTTVVDCPFL